MQPNCISTQLFKSHVSSWYSQKLGFKIAFADTNVCLDWLVRGFEHWKVDLLIPAKQLLTNTMMTVVNTKRHGEAHFRKCRSRTAFFYRLVIIFDLFFSLFQTLLSLVWQRWQVSASYSQLRAQQLREMGQSNRSMANTDTGKQVRHLICTI